MPHQKINDAGLNLIKAFEGLRLKAYKDSVGVWTIGYGHTKRVTRGQTITEAMATQLLREDVADAERAVNALAAKLRWPLNENQFSALVSFTFNLGTRNLAKLVVHGPEYVAKRILLFDHAGGEKLPGLTRRRQAERALFLRGVGGN